MIYLLLSIVFSTGINLIFRLFKKWSTDNLQAIVWNYFVCVLCGFIFNSDSVISDFNQAWSGYAFLLGFLFVGVFFLMAKTAQEYGIAVSAVSAKMAVVFPVLFGILIISEPIFLTTWLGISLSIISVWFVSFADKNAEMGKHWWLPLLVFVGSGIIDLSLKFINWKFANINEAHLAMTIFGIAGCIGLGVQFYRVAKGKSKFEWKNLWAGILLGVPNYFSIYYLLKAINIPNMPAVVLFPVNNIGVVLLSTLLSVLLFKEKLGNKKLVGILLSIVSILLLTYQLSK